MKRFLTIFCAIAISSAALSGQEADTNIVTSTDTLVVIVKHESGENFFDVVGKPFKKGYKAVEKTFVDGYKATEDAFVEPFTDTISTSRMYRRHYRADIGLNWCNPNLWGITSSHGYSFGNGLYVGGGVGFSAEMTRSAAVRTTDLDIDPNIDPEFSYTPNSNWKATYYVPVFADVKYSFINRLASPFVSAKLGAYGDVTNSGIRTLFNPSIGVDIARFSILVGYEHQYGVWGYGNGSHNHHVKLGLGFTF